MKLPSLPLFPSVSCAASVALLGLLPLPVLASSLAEYDFTNASLEPTSHDSGLKAFPVKWGDGMPLPNHGFGSGNASLFVRSSVVDQELSDKSDDYIEFTLDAQPGYALNLSSCAFVYGFSHGKEPVSQKATFTLRSSVDGYTTDLAQFTRISVATNVDTIPTGRIDLSSSVFKNISTVTFRIFFSDDGIDSTAYTLRLDAIEVHGDVVTGSIP